MTEAPLSRAERLVCISGFWTLGLVAEIGAYRWLEARPVFSLQLEFVALVFIGLAVVAGWPMVRRRYERG